MLSVPEEGEKGGGRPSQREARREGSEEGRERGRRDSLESTSVSALSLDDWVVGTQSNTVKRPSNSSRLSHRADGPCSVSVLGEEDEKGRVSFEESVQRGRKILEDSRSQRDAWRPRRPNRTGREGREGDEARSASSLLPRGQETLESGTHLLNELNKHQLAPSMRPKKLDLLSLTLPVRLQIEDPDSLVDGLLRHSSVRRPLSSSDGKKASLGDVNHVVPDERLSILSGRVSNERSDSRPGGEDVSSSNLDLGSEVVSDLVENPLDLGFLGDGVLLDGGGSIGGT